jgi:ATP-binding cassette subfamily F protein uup
MTLLVNIENICLAYGLDLLLDHVKLQVHQGERVCLIGRNGAGKSSLLKMLDGIVKPDSGQIWRKPNLRMARLEQELPQDTQLTVYEFVAQGLADLGKLLAEYHSLTTQIAETCTQKELDQLERIQREMDAKDAWQFEQKIKTVLTNLELDGDKRLAELSGGWQRRAALAKALVSSPELLLLDEPTNHLDIEAISWLENQLLSCDTALVFITHDRALLKRLATRIIELDRGQLTSWPGDYDNFLRRKEEMIHAEAKQNADFDKKLAEEERWIRQGIKARRTRNEGRVRALEAMRKERAARRDVQGKATFSLNEAEKSGQLVVEVKNVSHTFGDKPILKNFSIRIMRGDRIGLIGPNGVGKSTLLNILLGNLQPTAGEVQLGTKRQIAYFDQLRRTLNPDKTVIENVVEGSDTIEINGRRQHVIGYLSDFLFSPQRAMTPVKALSGGECNRLLLAKLFSQPANLLVLDEPTNDLDIETLELLEELLANFQGTLLIVSHDRAFLDQVVTSTLVFAGDGIVEEYVGGYADWLQQRKSIQTTVAQKTEKSELVKPARPQTKLSYKDQRELDELPAKIEKCDSEIQAIQQIMSDPDFYKQTQDKVISATTKLQELEEKLNRYYARWEELEAVIKR